MAPPQIRAERPAVFLDRDGVLNADLGYVFHVGDLKILPGVPEALAELKRRGYLLVVITNQSGVARGLFGTADVERFNAALNAELVKDSGIGVDEFYVCPHHPDGSVAEFRRACDCRKPGTALVLQAAAKHSIDLARSYFVGDKASDMECAVRAGVSGIQVLAPGEKQHPEASAYVHSLGEALVHIRS